MKFETEENGWKSKAWVIPNECPLCSNQLAKQAGNRKVKGIFCNSEVEQAWLSIDL